VQFDFRLVRRLMPTIGGRMRYVKYLRSTRRRQLLGPWHFVFLNFDFASRLSLQQFRVQQRDMGIIYLINELGFEFDLFRVPPE
jgi:hypothetical protein